MKRILVTILAFTLVACATPYQSFELFGRGGYTDKQLAEDTYQVAYYGNAMTKMETLNTMLLYRTAELTLDHGFDYFEVVKSYGRMPMSAMGGFRTVEHTVKLYKGQPSKMNGKIYVAKQVKDEFGPYIKQQK